MSDTLMRIELERLGKLWPAVAPDLGFNVQAQGAQGRITKLEQLRDDLERQLADVEDELEAMLGTGVRPSPTSTWAEVSEQLRVVESVAHQYGFTLPDVVAEAIEELCEPLVSVRFEAVALSPSSRETGAT